MWCESKNSQSGLKYFESGDASLIELRIKGNFVKNSSFHKFESAFLFNKYFKNEDFSNESLSLIELRIKGKYNHIKKSSFKNEDLYKHYKNFLANIKKSKKNYNSIEK